MEFNIGIKMVNSSRKINLLGIVYYLNEKDHLHRENGPAIIYPNGYTAWYKNNERYRKSGPAVIFSNGSYRFFRIYK